MNHRKRVYQQRLRRRFRVGKRIKGSAERPRLAVYRSLKHMYAQVIDDEEGRTLAAASTKELKGYGGNKDAASAVGKAIAAKAIAAGVKSVCFDRREFKYHGRIAALAEAAREAGLDF